MRSPPKRSASLTPSRPSAAAAPGPAAAPPSPPSPPQRGCKERRRCAKRGAAAASCCAVVGLTTRRGLPVRLSSSRLQQGVEGWRARTTCLGMAGWGGAAAHAAACAGTGGRGMAAAEGKRRPQEPGGRRPAAASRPGRRPQARRQAPSTRLLHAARPSGSSVRALLERSRCVRPARDGWKGHQGRAAV